MARGIFSLAYIKSDEAIRIQMILTLREALLRKSHDLTSCIRMGKKHLGAETPTRRRKRTAETSDAQQSLELAIDAAARIAAEAGREVENLTKIATALAKGNPVCGRLMTIPGVGPLTALTFFAAIDDVSRFKHSRNVGPYFGLTPRTYQSGATTKSGGISHRGDRSVRRALFLAARVMVVSWHSTCPLRRWGLRLAEAKGRRVAYIAVARKLAVLMHHLWVTGEEFDPGR